MISLVVISAGVELWSTLTEPALGGLKAHLSMEDPAAYELIVMDNGGRGRGDVNTLQMLPYGEAANLAADRAQGDRLLFLNNDIVVHGPFLPLLGKHPLEGPTLKIVDGDVLYVEGWALSIDRALWDLLGGFDTIYRNSWEDVDLSWRAGVLGICPQLIEPWPMTHLWGQTRSAVGVEANQWDHQNMLRLQAKKRRRAP